MDVASKSNGNTDGNKAENNVAAIPADDAHKTEKVTKVGRKDLTRTKAVTEPWRPI